MEKDILSLRNIYRFLTVNDYPVYSTGVFREDNRKGLTLTKFWQENLLYEFRNGYYGKMIWNLSGGRNRHTSEICNRSQVLKYYAQYTEELISAINEKILVQQINQFKTCLQERKGDWAVLEKKIEAAITVFHAQDDCFEKDVLEFFQKNLEDGEALFDRDMEAKSFFLCWMLTFLTIHAMAGEEMNNVQMKNLRQNRAFSLKSLWAGLQDGTNNGSAEVHFLTGQNNALCITPLPMIHFFGRERELFDLREILEQGGYYLLSGMGGIGKTELLRQLLHLCVEQKLVDEVAVIQYEGSLKTGCMKAFPNMHLVDGENTLNEAMARIRMQEGKRVLTLVDNMNNTLEEDPELEQLLTLPGTVILTSRLTSLEGFTTYEVKAPGKETGMLIFRDNYGKALSKEDKEELQDLLEQDIWCHTLTLRLLGSTARVKGWSVGALKEKLEEDGFRLLKTRENREISLAEMYRRMYDLSELSESQVRFLRCFAALPYQNYTEEFMKKFLRGYFADSREMQEELEQLQAYGWINESKEGYSMHPVIQECVLFVSPKKEDVLPFAEALEEYWWKKCGSQEKRMEDWYLYTLGADEEDYRLLTIWAEVVDRLRGQLSGGLGKVTIMALWMEDNLVASLPFTNLGKRINDIVAEAFRMEVDILSVYYVYKDKADYYMSMWKNRKNLGMNDWQQKIYGIELGGALIRNNELLTALEILEELNKDGITGWMSMLLGYIRALAYIMQMKLREAYEILSGVLKELKQTNAPDGAYQQSVILQQINICTELGKFEEAKALLAQLEDAVKKNGNIVAEYKLAYAKGIPFRNMGNIQEVCKSQEEAVRLAKLLTGKSNEYAISSADLGLLLCKCSRMEEAEKYYLEAMSILTQNHEFDFRTSRAYNNMADMYICWNKPQQAIECMEKSTEYGKDIQGIGLAERYRNFARAYRLAEDTQMEYENLKQAVPLLAEAYGPDHERTVAMRERLEEVEELRKKI